MKVLFLELRDIHLFLSLKSARWANSWTYLIPLSAHPVRMYEPSLQDKDIKAQGDSCPIWYAKLYMLCSPPALGEDAKFQTPVLMEY